MAAPGMEARFAMRRAAVAASVESLVARHVDPFPGTVADAIRYSLAGEGKRLRALLVLESYAAAGGAGDASVLAAAVEVVHAYSLVHDDLPCMDDDDLRRGRPTAHKLFGVRTATAAGMAMVPLAALAAAEGVAVLGLDQGRGSEIVRTLMRASGAGGMIGGQLLDLEGEGRALSLAELEGIHRRKTGALIEASMVLGGLAAGADDVLLRALARFGASIGLAFQVADDVLDITATSVELGKTAGKDVADQKSTYPALLGLEGAKGRAAEMVREGCSALEGVGALTDGLLALARFTVDRRS